MNNFGKLKDLVMSLEDDFSKFYDKQNAAAGTRVRKGMQELKTMAQAFRTEVQNTKNAGAAAAPAAGAAKKAAPAKKRPRPRRLRKPLLLLRRSSSGLWVSFAIPRLLELFEFRGLDKRTIAKKKASLLAAGPFWCQPGAKELLYFDQKVVFLALLHHEVLTGQQRHFGRRGIGRSQLFAVDAHAPGLNHLLGLALGRKDFLHGGFAQQGCGIHRIEFGAEHVDVGHPGKNVEQGGFVEGFQGGAVAFTKQHLGGGDGGFGRLRPSARGW
jgi:hypothetical protein